MKLIATIVCCVLFSTGEKQYVKNYFGNGKLKEEGWMTGSIKVDYWFFYFENGQKQAEGSFDNNIKNKYWKFYSAAGKKEKEGRFAAGLENGWWIFYENNKVKRKAEYAKGKLHGYVFYYSDKGDISLAQKYNNGNKIGEWTDVASFKRDN